MKARAMWNGNKPIGVVAAGGRGTRMAPATHFVNKHLLPIGGGKLMIDEPLSFMASQGFKKIHVVTGMDHAGQVSEHIQDGENHGFVGVDYAIQPKPAGIADVVARTSGKLLVGAGMLLILGDNYFEDHDFIPWESMDYDHAHAFEYNIGSIEKAKSFGQAIVKGTSGVYSIVEKPKNPEHSFILTGLYYFPFDVYEKVMELSPSARGELEITGLLQMYAEENRLKVNKVYGKWCDLGEWSSWAEFVGMKNREEKYAAESDFGGRSGIGGERDFQT